MISVGMVREREKEIRRSSESAKRGSRREGRRAIQSSDTYRGDEELRTVRVRATVRHRQRAWLGVLQLEVLVGELGAVDRFAASAVVVGEVATLQHEARNHTVERAALEAEAFLVRAQSAEVLGRSRDDVRAELREKERRRRCD